jgi:hypothetical protein
MNYVIVVMAIFVIFVTGLWILKRKAYSGPQFDIIMGTNLPRVETTAGENEKDVQHSDKSNVSASTAIEGSSRNASSSH